LSSAAVPLMKRIDNGADGHPRRSGASDEVLHLVPPELAAGVLICSGRGCGEQTGIACAHTDRRGRACPTAWCPRHRVVHREEVYCPLHALVLGADPLAFTENHRADLDNKVGLLVNWVVRQVDAQICVVLEKLCADYRHKLVVDPVHFALVGLDRIRTWERYWKVCSHTGIALRLAVAVEESVPGVVIGRVGSKNVIRVDAPAADVRQRAEDPGVAEPPDIAGFRAALVGELAAAAEAWRSGHPVPNHVQVVGEVMPVAPIDLLTSSPGGRVERAFASWMRESRRPVA